MGMNKICCIFLNHQQHLYKDVYEKMSNSVDYIDFYNYNPDWGAIIKTFGNLMFKDRSCGSNITSGNAIFAVLYFKVTHPEYDYYFACENDVLFTGDYKLLFDELTKNIYNYDAIIDKPLSKEDGWFWVQRESDYKLLDGFSKENYYNQLYVFFCFSNKVIDYIIQKYKDGYYGHQELIISCALKLLNGKYDYLKAHFRTKLVPFVQQMRRADLFSRNKLIHPVKQKYKI